MIGRKLQGNQIHLRPIERDDCNQVYLGWLQDPRVNQFLETRWEPQTVETLRSFVDSTVSSSGNYLYAICDNLSNIHVGNIKLGPIHETYRNADLSYFIGNVDYWHRGIATEAISLVTDFALEDLSLRRLSAGVYEKNVASSRALEKVGFTLEGRFRCAVLASGQWQDVLRYGLLVEDYRGHTAARSA